MTTHELQLRFCRDFSIRSLIFVKGGCSGFFFLLLTPRESPPTLINIVWVERLIRIRHSTYSSEKRKWSFTSWFEENLTFWCQNNADPNSKARRSPFAINARLKVIRSGFLVAKSVILHFWCWCSWHRNPTWFFFLRYYIKKWGSVWKSSRFRLSTKFFSEM